MLKATTPLPRAASQPRRHNPLSDDLIATGLLRAKSNKRKAKRDDDGRDNYVDSKSSRKILKIGRDLVEEDHEQSRSVLPNTAFTFESRFGGEDGSEDGRQSQDEDAWGDDDAVFEEAVR